MTLVLTMKLRYLIAYIGLLALGIILVQNILIGTFWVREHPLTPSLTANSSPVPMPLPGRYCFVHVGKAAGSTLSCALGYRYAPTCPKESVRHTKLKLYQHRGPFAHTHKMQCSPDVPTFLVSLRNPIDRIVSWFNYENTNSSFIRPFIRNLPQDAQDCTRRLWHVNGTGCFKTFSEFSESCTWTEAKNPSDPKAGCQQLAWNVSRGDFRCGWHNAFNYAYYFKHIQNWRKGAKRATHLVAIRTEHIADDWDRLELMFGGTTEGSGAKIFEKSLNRGGFDKTLASPRGLQNLCLALCPEIQVYKRILYMAENLNEEQRRESIAEVARLCPEEAGAERECPLV
jgi:hypothetical protein